MRKLLFIVLALAGCLLFAEQSGGVTVAQPHEAAQRTATAVLSAGGSTPDVWQCERVCNSDLNQPQTLRAVESCPAAQLIQRGGNPARVLRGVVRCAASCGCGTGVAKLIFTFRSANLCVGTHAVDYYVYRLRRLLI